MQSRIRPILTETLWVFTALAVTILICRFVFMWDFSQNEIDLHLHDTYFVLSVWRFIPLIFLFITFVLYFTREIRNAFHRIMPNVILLTAGLSLIALLVSLNKMLSTFGGTMGGWTSFPPLSAMPQVEQGRPFFDGVTNALTILQIALVIALLYVVYMWGRHAKQNS